jgi:hypothetical protein
MNAPVPSIAKPLQQPISAATREQAIQFMILQRLLRVQTATLVQVQAVHGGGLGPVGTVDVLPLVDQVDGAGNAIPHVTLYGRPYVRWQGGLNAVILDPKVGDLGLIVFGSRDLSAVIKSKQHGPPPTARNFAYPDGLYVAGMLNGTPQNYVQFLENGAINVVSTVSISLQAPEINITGTVNANGARISEAGEVTDALGIVLGTHEHSGVSSGSSNTGPPVP